MKKLLIAFVLVCIFVPPVGQLAVDKATDALSRVATGQAMDDVLRWAQDRGVDGVSDVAGLSGELNAAEGVVARVVDGDTVVLADGRVVRLLQIDAPEADGECYGEKAARVLSGLLKPGTEVRLAKDRALDDADGYGRLLRYVWADTVFLNARLVVLGAAAPYFYEGRRGRYAPHLERYAVQARDAGVGLWGDCHADLDPSRAVATHPA